MPVSRSLARQLKWSMVIRDRCGTNSTASSDGVASVMQNNFHRSLLLVRLSEKFNLNNLIVFKCKCGFHDGADVVHIQVARLRTRHTHTRTESLICRPHLMGYFSGINWPKRNRMKARVCCDKRQLPVSAKHEHRMD